MILLKAPEVIKYNRSVCKKRYLDDIFSILKETIRQFNQFVAAETVSAPLGIQFQGSCDKKTEFLDVLIDKSEGVIKPSCLSNQQTPPPTFKRGATSISMYLSI
jgi:hypothetical protein